jgi:hypothetical protein
VGPPLRAGELFRIKQALTDGPTWFSTTAD